MIAGINGFIPEIKEDKNSSTQQTSGIIEDIRNVSNPPRFYYEGHIVMPKYLVIDGNEYYIMTTGDFVVGDSVEIEYLPSSLVIITINSE